MTCEPTTVSCPPAGGWRTGKRRPGKVVGFVMADAIQAIVAVGGGLETFPLHQLTVTEDAMPETIVAAAIRTRFECPGTPNSEQIVSAPPPARHHTLIHPLNHHAKGGGYKRVQPEDQGFLTSTGRFVDRKEAMTIAVSSGQPMINHPSRNNHTLYSEDLW